MKKISLLTLALMSLVSTSVFAAETPEALKALLRNPTMKLAPASDASSVGAGKMIMDVLSTELLGQNTVTSSCETIENELRCSVNLSSQERGSIVFIYTGVKAKSGAILIRSAVEAYGN